METSQLTWYIPWPKDRLRSRALGDSRLPERCSSVFRISSLKSIKIERREPLKNQSSRQHKESRFIRYPDRQVGEDMAQKSGPKEKGPQRRRCGYWFYRNRSVRPVYILSKAAFLFPSLQKHKRTQSDRQGRGGKNTFFFFYLFSFLNNLITFGIIEAASFFFFFLLSVFFLSYKLTTVGYLLLTRFNNPSNWARGGPPPRILLLSPLFSKRWWWVRVYFPILKGSQKHSIGIHQTYPCDNLFKTTANQL